MNTILKCMKATATCISLFAIISLFVSCKKTTPPDTKYIKDFHVTNFYQSSDMLDEDNLASFLRILREMLGQV